MSDGFAQRLRMEMGRLGWDNKRLKEELGIGSEHTVGKWVNGVSLPQPEQLERLAAKLGIDPGYLLYGPVRTGGPAAALAIIQDVLRQVDVDPAGAERMAAMWRAFRNWRDQQGGGEPPPEE